MRDWDDSWYDDDEEFPVPRKGKRTGIIVAVVVTFVVAGFNALTSPCLLLCGSLFALVDNNAPFGPAGLVEHQAFILLALGMGNAASFLAQLFAGIGLLNGRPWARILSLIVAGYATLVSGFLIWTVVSGINQGALQDDSRIPELVFALIAIVVQLGYAAVIFLVMFNRRATATLRK